MAIITLSLILWFFNWIDNNMVLVKIVVFLTISSNDYSKNVELKKTAVLY